MTIKVMDLCVLFLADVALQCMIHSFVLDINGLTDLRLIVEIL